ncbi:MAG: hypothetical protein NT120_03130 [Candidatus Aenigmarchaeota archaeon]|nr:hypothetical protein [Candidatus Aenigmarchaeota archaeon]
MMKILALLLMIVFIAGCVDTTAPTIGKPGVQLGTPYSVNPNTIGFSIDANISVPVNNTRSDIIKIDIVSATITAKLKDGTIKAVSGYGDSITIPSKQIMNISVKFKGIPSIYTLQENPFRLVPSISAYSISVRYKATVKIMFGLIPYTEEDVYTQTIPTQEIPIDKSLFTNVLNSV